MRRTTQAVDAGPGAKRRLRVLVAEAFASGSHRSWAEGLARRSGHEVRLVTHPGRFWKWRMQGGALTLGDAALEAARAWPPDVVVVSGMVHAAAFAGYTRRVLADAALVLYLHENQLTYPAPEGAERDETYAMTTWLSMAAADAVVLNSEHHRRELFEALPGFLRRFPDLRHGRFLAEVESRSTVLPVGVDTAPFAAAGVAARRRPVWGRDRPGGRSDLPVVLWNHRWDSDKDPDAFAEAVEDLAAAGVRFRLALAGEIPRTRTPPTLERLSNALGDRIVHLGTAAAEDYPALLGSSDVVVSTARHEFFGVAVAEAMAAGVHPILPRRLSYPELVPGPTHGACLYDSPEGLRTLLAEALADPGARRRVGDAVADHVRRCFDWSVVAPRYDELFRRVAAGGRPARAAPAVH